MLANLAQPSHDRQLERNCFIIIDLRQRLPDAIEFPIQFSGKLNLLRRTNARTEENFNFFITFAAFVRSDSSNSSRRAFGVLHDGPKGGKDCKRYGPEWTALEWLCSQVPASPPTGFGSIR
ncbi:hypothetical protein ZHAS_00022045 [Anopheles sinensis]|uniref:Uncharacterized protein n=1 Tax=Anopheles sinensis TaxID=74873 RepID=A0A084WUB3_ANOSI|nr:hypothetical protein ZHAS_00022045 [Anopheles sinensis]